ncbi:hypothetical protein RSSM_03002 [Rhodopirellula sallentina SM41]|uniref:Uncharacterized protein n=1 Tax=Rhodopirellula sallentina SM41 TaxID=1263870 RepID=M5U255_9BACT|nr:hypothetical protein RSSM_03002 [Rhodopirellula sallentina SM41]
MYGDRPFHPRYPPIAPFFNAIAFRKAGFLRPGLFNAPDLLPSSLLKML